MSAAWNVIVVGDLSDYLVADQLTALREAALGEGQDDPFTRLMHDRCNYVRNRISQRIQISQTPYAVPPELKTCACMLIIEVMSVRLSVAIELTEDQKTLVKRAYDDLDIAGTDKFPISTPDDPVQPAVQSGGGVRVVNKTTRHATSDTMKGL